MKFGENVDYVSEKSLLNFGMVKFLNDPTILGTSRIYR